MTEFPGTSWRDHLPEVLAGLRMLPNTTGLSPYLICFKQPVTWIGDTAARVGVDVGETAPKVDE